MHPALQDLIDVLAEIAVEEALTNTAANPQPKTTNVTNIRSGERHAKYVQVKKRK
jgi:hypothetical protein